MSGLVTGLQNRAQRFESASDLNKKAQVDDIGLRFFVLYDIVKDGDAVCLLKGFFRFCLPSCWINQC